jgi:hypothetical protein
MLGDLVNKLKDVHASARAAEEELIASAGKSMDARENYLKFILGRFFTDEQTFLSYEYLNRIPLSEVVLKSYQSKEYWEETHYQKTQRSRFYLRPTHSDTYQEEGFVIGESHLGLVFRGFSSTNSHNYEGITTPAKGLTSCFLMMRDGEGQVKIYFHHPDRQQTKSKAKRLNEVMQDDAFWNETPATPKMSTEWNEAHALTKKDFCNVHYLTDPRKEVFDEFYTGLQRITQLAVRASAGICAEDPNITKSNNAQTEELKKCSKKLKAVLK